MRIFVMVLLCVSTGGAQFKTTVQLVFEPTTITYRRGQPVDGIGQEELTLFDNNVPQPIQLDWTNAPIDLVVAVQTSSNSRPVIDKLGASGILLSQLIAADAGETALVTFNEHAQARQDFTAEPDRLTHALRMLRTAGEGAATLDALAEARRMLEGRPAKRRRIVLLLREKKDRGSYAKLNDVMEHAQRLNATIYWLSYSPFLQPFTVKPRTMEELKPIGERDRLHPNENAAPLDVGPGGLLYGLGEMVRLKQPDLAVLFSKSTGGTTMGFLKKNALEDAIHSIGAEVHRQYMVSFAAPPGEPGAFHAIRVSVKGRPELTAKTRDGYFAVSAP